MEKYFSSFCRRRYYNEKFIAHILSFLPAKSVVKANFLSRCVRSLTSEDFFALLQSRRAYSVDSGFFAAYKYGANMFFVDQRAGIPADALEFLRSAATILSSANGLIIYFDRTVPDGSTAVYNPVRRTSLSIPRPSNTELSHDHFIGVSTIVSKEPCSLDYNLVCVEPAAEWGGNPHCKIYDSRDGEWKADHVLVRGAEKRNLRLDEPVVCGSAVFWASTCGAYMKGVDPYVVALDVDAAAVAPSSRIVPLPPEAVAAGSPDDYEIRIARWGKTGLCLIQYQKPASVFAMWSLATTKTNEEDAAAATAWKKICEVGFEEMKLRKRRIGSFTLINGDILVFIALQRRRLYGYSLSSRQLKKLGRVDSPYSALIPYANTLRPCGRDEKVVADNIDE